MQHRRFALISSALLLAAAALPALGAEDTFSLSASARDFDTYFPSYLANGYFSTMTAPRGTEGNLAYMVAFMDYGKDDESRPAAIPGWSEIDYSTGDSRAGHFWMNQAPLNPAVFADYRQTLNMKEATLTTSYRYVDHQRSTEIKVTTFVSQASTHLAATQVSLTPDFEGTVELSFALNLWAPHQPRLPLAKLTGEQMQEAVAANNLQLVAIAPATPDRAALWYHGDTHVLAANGDVKNLTLSLDGRAEQGLNMAEAAAVALPDGVVPGDIALYKSEYRLALNVKIKVQKNRTYIFTKFVAASREGWGGDARADLTLATAARQEGFNALLDQHRAAWRTLWRSDIRDRWRCAGADGRTLRSLLSARNLNRRHALADGCLRTDARLYRPCLLGQRYLDLSRALAAASRARQVSRHVPRVHAACGADPRTGARSQGRDVSLGGGPGKWQRTDPLFRACAQ